MPPVVRLVAQLNQVIADQVRALALEVHANLVEATPVDTGWARANWIPVISDDNNSVIDAQGNIGAASGQQAAGVAEVLAYNLSQGKIFVSNHVPYIENLNMGHSQQAPAGFVEAAIDKAIRTVL